MTTLARRKMFCWSACSDVDVVLPMVPIIDSISSCFIPVNIMTFDAKVLPSSGGGAPSPFHGRLFTTFSLPVREVDPTQDHTSNMYVALSQQPELTMTACQTAQHNLPGTEMGKHIDI